MFKFALFLAAVVGVASQTCGPDGGKIEIAGSSTVEPIARIWATEYVKKCSTINVTVQGGGSSVGAGRVCANPVRGTPVDIGDMSRKWSATEASATDGINYSCLLGDRNRKTTQIEVGLDGITLALVSGGLAAQCLRKVAGLSQAQVRWMFSNFTEEAMGLTSANISTVIPNSDNNATSRNWGEIAAVCPGANIRISGPDSLSGTNEFFREALGFQTREGFATNRPGGYFNSAKDEEIVQYVETSSQEVYGDAVSYFGFSFFLEEGALLYGVPIRNAAGQFTPPTKASIETDAYNPLSRRLYMQVLQNDASLLNTKPFLAWGLSNTGTVLTDSTGYVGLPLDQRTAMLARLALPAPNDEAPKQPVAAPTVSGDVDEPIVIAAENCGLLRLNFFCFTGCGFFGRLLGLCDQTR
jgi:ABC-type phosphate transport system substrate-binding protein